jgi:hypothetical protein
MKKLQSSEIVYGSGFLQASENLMGIKNCQIWVNEYPKPGKLRTPYRNVEQS